MLLQLTHHPALQSGVSFLGSFIAYRPEYPLLDPHQSLMPVACMAWAILFIGWNMLAPVEPSPGEKP